MIKQSVVSVALAASLAGCASANGGGPNLFNTDSFGPPTPRTPAAKDVLQATIDTSGLANQATEDKIAALGATDSNAPAYVAVGYNNVYRLCNDYFDKLIISQNESQFSNDVVTEAASAATAILGLARAKPNAIGITAAGTGLLSSVIMSYNSRALMTPYPSETKSLIMAALAEFQANAPPSSAHTKLDAIYLVQHYAEICTYSGITRLSKMALSTSSVTTASAQAPANLTEISQTIGQFLSTPNLTPTNAEDLYYYLATKPDLWSTNPTAAKTLIATLPQNAQASFEDQQGAPIDWSTSPSISGLTKVLKLLYGEQSSFKTATDAEGVKLTAKITQNASVAGPTGAPPPPAPPGRAAAAAAAAAAPPPPPPPPAPPPPAPPPLAPAASAPQIVINGGNPK